MANSSKEALIEVFGTPGADPAAVRRWKMTWRDSKQRLQIRNFTEAVKLLNSAGVDPLFYQFYSDTQGDGDGSKDVAEKYYVTFFKDEHYVFFKLHSGIA